jgi:hypothetical protein
MSQIECAIAEEDGMKYLRWRDENNKYKADSHTNQMTSKHSLLCCAAAPITSPSPHPTPPPPHTHPDLSADPPTNRRAHNRRRESSKEETKMVTRLKTSSAAPPHEPHHHQPQYHSHMTQPFHTRCMPRSKWRPSHRR